MQPLSEVLSTQLPLYTVSVTRFTLTTAGTVYNVLPYNPLRVSLLIGCSPGTIFFGPNANIASNTGIGLNANVPFQMRWSLDGPMTNQPLYCVGLAAAVVVQCVETLVSLGS